MFPLIIIIVLIFLGGVYWTTTFNQAQTTTTINNSSNLYTGYSLMNTITGFASEQWVIIGFLVFLIFFVGILAVLRSGGE